MSRTTEGGKVRYNPESEEAAGGGDALRGAEGSVADEEEAESAAGGVEAEAETEAETEEGATEEGAGEAAEEEEEDPAEGEDEEVRDEDEADEDKEATVEEEAEEDEDEEVADDDEVPSAMRRFSSAASNSIDMRILRKDKEGSKQSGRHEKKKGNYAGTKNKQTEEAAAVSSPSIPLSAIFFFGNFLLLYTTSTLGLLHRNSNINILLALRYERKR